MPAASPSVIAFSDPAPPTMEVRPDPDRIVGGDPAQRVVNRFASRDGRFNCGLWECEPGAWRVRYTEDEFCHLLEGEVVLRGADGSERRFTAGDAFVIPAGFEGIWETVRRARKYYAMYE